MPTTPDQPGRVQPRKIPLDRMPSLRQPLTRQEADRLIARLTSDTPALLPAADLSAQLGMAYEQWHDLFDPAELEWLARVKHRLDVIAEHHDG